MFAAEIPVTVSKWITCLRMIGSGMFWQKSVKRNPLKVKLNDKGSNMAPPQSQIRAHKD